MINLSRKPLKMQFRKPALVVMAVLVVIAVMGMAAYPAAAASQTLSYFPTFSIVSVVTDTTVTIITYNFPANDVFNVYMGPMGTRAVNGIWVASQQSGNGGTFTATYNIPDALKGSYQIAIRLQSSTGSGYYAYNWFYNDTSTLPPPGSGVPGSGYAGFPTFSILSVVRDKSVTVQTYNLPANDSFVVTMGLMGTRGINGYVVATTASGAGGSQQLTYDIPAALAGLYQISIRMASTTSGYYAYNWFYNNTTGSVVPVPPVPPVVVYPTFSISSVTRDGSVSIQAYNFPANDTYNVYMGPMGTQGIGGILVDTISTGAGGSFPATFTIPAALYGSYQISIRLQSPTTGYYAYNWFYNNTTPY